MNRVTLQYVELFFQTMLGMEATLSNAGKMQSVIASDTLTTLPLAPKSLPSTSLMSQVALKPGETCSTGSKTGERALKSLWIRRLKPWDEPENANGNTVDFASEIKECRGLCSEKVDAESSLQPDGGHFQERTFMNPRVEKQSTKNKALDRDQTVLNMRTEASPDTRQQIVQKDSGVDRQRNDFRLGKESSNLMAVPFSIGFGPWINLSAGTRLGGKPQMGHAFEPIVAFQACKQAGESTTQKSNNGKVQVEASTMVSSIGKPSLPPAHSKLGLPLRPVGLKTQGPSLLIAGRATSSPHGKGAVVFEPSLRPLHMPVSTKTLSATGIHAGSLLKDACPAKEGCSDVINSHPKEDMAFASEKRSHFWVIPAAAHGDGLIPELQARVSAVEPVTRQSLVSYSEGLSSPLMAKSWVSNKRKASEGTDAIALELKSSKDFASFETPKILHEIPAANLHSEPPSGELITAVKQTDSKELKGSTLHQPASEGSYGTTKSDRAEVAEPAPSASTTASSPWEMFVEAAGPSKIAREQFVEVYNRARDELKNQKASHGTNRISDKETQKGPGLTSRHGTCKHDIPTDMLKRQTSQIQQQPVGCLQVKNISGSLDHIVQSWGVSAKALNAPGMSAKTLIAHVSQRETIVRKQHAVSLSEGEVQGLLERKAAAFWTIHGHGADGGEDAALVSGQHNVTLRDYVCPAAASKDRLRTLDKSSEGGVHTSQGFASNSAIEQHQVPSKHKDFPQPKALDKAAVVSNDLNDRQDKASVLLGKRQRGIFDSGAAPSALVVDKGPTVHHEGLPIRSHVWLQRWCPNISNIKGVHGMNKPKHRDGCGAFNKATEKKSIVTDKEVFAQRIGTEPESECLKMGPTKVLPSAAAMAIVGTAARQFCNAQPQQKGSFAFWSGFGTPTPPKPDAFIAKGKKSFSFEANPSVQS